MQIYLQFSELMLPNPPFAVLLRRHARHTLEVLAEERGVGEVHLVGYLGRTLVGMAQLHLDTCHDGVVNPLLGSLAADLLHQCAHVAGRQEEALSVEVYVVLLRGILADQSDKVGEEALLTCERTAVFAFMLAPVLIRLPEKGRYQVEYDLRVALMSLHSII